MCPVTEARLRTRRRGLDVGSRYTLAANNSEAKLPAPPVQTRSPHDNAAEAEAGGAGVVRSAGFPPEGETHAAREIHFPVEQRYDIDTGCHNKRQAEPKTSSASGTKSSLGRSARQPAGLNESV